MGKNAYLTFDQAQSIDWSERGEKIEGESMTDESDYIPLTTLISRLLRGQPTGLKSPSLGYDYDEKSKLSEDEMLEKIPVTRTPDFDLPDYHQEKTRLSNSIQEGKNKMREAQKKINEAKRDKEIAAAVEKKLAEAKPVPPKNSTSA